ncbi:MAG TPA: peptide chain release factor 2, partial [bacterium]|nr:peptide chain release factor 2 [bacterium]
RALLTEWKAFQAEVEELEAGLALWEEENDPALGQELEGVLKRAEKRLAALELQNLLGGQDDEKNAIVLIHSGAGGTESADWAAMLFRMYQRWAENHGYPVTILDYQPGEEAGLKSVTFEVEGDYTYGHLKTEGGVHRLVRISPFDANKRRHTSFASVFVYPDIEETGEVEINEADLKVDTYRSSGAGGQHVNTTDSAIRITHLPTGIVVTCQNERSQHKNRSSAMKVLRAKLYELKRQEQEAEKDKLNAQKRRIAWGSQIRSYVLHPYQLVKDHRTDFETSASAKVLDGDIDPFIEAALVKKVV